MFSRFFYGLSTASLLAGLVAFSGCSLKLHNNEAAPQLLTVTPGGGCLDKAGAVFDAYSKGELSQEAHDGFYECVKSAFNTFSTYADGRNQDFYQPQEIGNFFTKYFLNGKEIPAPLQAELMAVKNALIGGGASQVSRQELRQIISLLDVLKGVTGSLRPYMPFDAQSFADRHFESEQFETAMKTFVAAVDSFGQAVQNNQAEYSFDHVPALATALSNFLYGNNPPSDNWADSVVRYAAVMRPAKAILISPPRDRITAQDWPKLYRLAPRFFTIYSRFNFYRFTPVEYTYGVGLQRLETFWSEFMALFQSVVQAQPAQSISSDMFDDLLNELSNAKLMSIAPGTVHNFLASLFGHVFGNSPVKNGKFFVVANSLQRLDENVHFTLEGLHANEALFRSLLGDSDFLTRGLRENEVNSVPDATLLNATTLKNGLSLEAVEALKRSATEINTIFQRDSWDIVIPKGARTKQVTLSHMAKIHILRAVDRMLLEAYGTRNSSRLADGQLDQMLNELMPIALEAKLIDDQFRAKLEKRVKNEAPLFLYASDGQPGLSMNEALELEALVLATFKRAADNHDAVAADCHVATRDANGQPLPSFTIPAPCYRKTFVSHIPQFWSYIPGFVDFMNAHPRSDQETVFNNLEAFLRKDVPLTNDFDMGDSQAFVLMPYYIEILYSRFDANNDGLIDTNEGDVAYPVFRPFIAKKAAEKGYTDPKDFAAIYNFLLANRELPTDDQWDYAIHRYVVGRQEFTVDRAQMVQIFQKLLSL
jgi:hypothetical protein